MPTLQASWSLCTWFLAIAYAAAQSGCAGDTSTYDEQGLSVDFQNLCGKDITAQVDFMDPTNEATWSQCLARCVEKEPLCYGFDFTPLDTAPFNCWLMNGTFAVDTAVSQPYAVDAAMLGSELLAGLSEDCKSMGLVGCFEKNGRLGTETATAEKTPSSTSPPVTAAAAPPSTTSDALGPTTIVVTVTAGGATSPSAPPSPESKRRGLSTGAKAGIGAGIGVIALLGAITGGFLLLQRRNQRALGAPANIAHTGGVSEKMVDEDARAGGARSELSAQQDAYRRSELEDPRASLVAEGRHDGLRLELDSRSTSRQTHELSGSGSGFSR
ncbi:hypothetical protein BDV95DRAFT_601155 [Massariosphaeria phaeospora]|uniref:Apple domain-containing protein n=1 Tax=Massariosphaeria phaeospora TaxID=100035 RepID=A0A7C8IFR4_9PLEO|nr:hypothetical protein BDV95DRAFT_601155 [Massariosphaeria phaeospora]